MGKDVQQFIDVRQVTVVACQDDYANASDSVKLALAKIKEVNDTRLEMTRPLDESKKKIMAQADLILKPLEAFVNQTKQAMLNFYRAEQARAAEAERKERERVAEENRKREEEHRKAVVAAQKEAEEAGVPEEFATTPAAPAPVVAEQIITAQTTSRGSVSRNTVRQDWKYEIVDASKIPYEYLMPDTAKLTKAVRSGGVREIAGLRIYDAGNISVS